MDQPIMSFASLQNPNGYNMEGHLMPPHTGPMSTHGSSMDMANANQGRPMESHPAHALPPHLMPMSSLGSSPSQHHQGYSQSNNMDGSMFMSNYQNQSHINPMEEYMMSTLGLQAKHSASRNSGTSGVPPLPPMMQAPPPVNQQPPKDDSGKGPSELPFPSLQSKNMTEDMVQEVAEFIARKGEKREIKKQSLMKRLARQSETAEQAEVRKAKDRERKARKRAAERLDYNKAVELREKVKHQRRLSRLAETPEQTIKRRERDRMRNAERRSAIAVLNQMYNDIKNKADETKSITECEAEVLKLYYEYLRVRQQLKEGARILASCTQAAAEAALVTHIDVGDEDNEGEERKEEGREEKEENVKEEPKERKEEGGSESDATEMADDVAQENRMAEVADNAPGGAENRHNTQEGADVASKQDSETEDSDSDSDSSSCSSGSTSRNEANDLDPRDPHFDPDLIVKKEPFDEALAQIGFYGLPIAQLPVGQGLPFMPELQFNALSKENESEADEEVEDFRVLEHSEQAVIYECGICCRMFMAVGNFQDHVNKHLKVTPYTCCECYQVFSTRYGLRMHLEKESHEAGVACALCDERFYTLDTLGAHASKQCMRQPRACDIVLAAKKRKSIGDLPKPDINHTLSLANSCNNSSMSHSASQSPNLNQNMTPNTTHNMTHSMTQNMTPNVPNMSHSTNQHTTQNMNQMTHNIGQNMPHNLGQNVTHCAMQEQALRSQQCDEQIPCPVCNDMIPKKSLARHVKSHSQRKPVNCQMCGKSCKDQYDLRIHMKVHQDGGNYRCEKCDQTFLYPADLDEHLQSHKEEDSLQVACIVTGCHRVFASQESLKKHLAWHLENPNFKKSVEIVEPKVLYCNIQGCKGSFTSQMMFRCHVEIHKDEPKCLLCGIKIVDKKIFKQHLQIHETLGDFKQHSKDSNSNNNGQSSSTEIEIRSFTCPECNLEYPRLTALHDHMAEHNKWVCHLCGQEKRKRGELLKHLNHHYNKRDCVCEICGNSFVNKQVLKAHYIQHTEDKPYTCKECKASFRYSHGYVQHLRHHSGKRLECKPCGKLFLTKQGVDRHIKKTHPHILENGKIPNSAFEHVVKSEAEILANGAVSHAVPPWVRQNTGFQKPENMKKDSLRSRSRSDTSQENESQQAGVGSDYKTDDDTTNSESEDN